MPVIKKISNHTLRKEQTVDEISTPSISYFDGYLADVEDDVLSLQNLVSISNKVDNYDVTTDEDGYTFVMKSSDNKAFDLPSVGEEEDGISYIFVKAGSGNVTINAADSDNVSWESSAGGSVANSTAGEVGATIHLKYCHEIITWVVISYKGTWAYS